MPAALVRRQIFAVWDNLSPGRLEKSEFGTLKKPGHRAMGRWQSNGLKLKMI
jgi:hypothetical protein